LIGKVHTFVKDASAYFGVSTKRQTSLADELEGLGAKILKAVHMIITRWLSTCPALQRVLDTYDGLVKLSAKDPTNASHLYETLTNLEAVLTMLAFMPMLKVLNSFVKTAQTRGIFILDLLRDLQLVRDLVKSMYINPQTRFRSRADQKEMTDFEDFANFLAAGAEGDAAVEGADVLEGDAASWATSRLKWVNGVLNMRLVDGELHEMSACKPTRFAPGRPNPRAQPVTPELFEEVVKYVRMQMSTAANKFLTELGHRFPPDNILQS
jgi:hypothetical protein